MKKVLSILASVILLLSGLQISVDRHYCGGRLVDAKISFSGEMASCGMEESEKKSTENLSFDKRCCEDQVTFYSLVNNYSPEYSSFEVPAKFKTDIPFLLSDNIARNSFVEEKKSWSHPPGNFNQSRLTQPDLCVFRI